MIKRALLVTTLALVTAVPARADEPAATDAPKLVDLDTAILTAIEAYPTKFKSIKGKLRQQGKFDISVTHDATICVKDALRCEISNVFMMKSSNTASYTVLVFQSTEDKYADAAFDVVSKHIKELKLPFETVGIDNGTKPDRFRLWQPKPSSNPDPKYKDLTIGLFEVMYLTGDTAPKPTKGHAVYVRIGKQ